MTAEQKAAYLKNPDSCPYCKSTFIEAGPIEADGDSAWCDITCVNPQCQEKWRDVYTLTSVEAI